MALGSASCCVNILEDFASGALRDLLKAAMIGEPAGAKICKRYNGSKRRRVQQKVSNMNCSFAY